MTRTSGPAADRAGLLAWAVRGHLRSFTALVVLAAAQGSGEALIPWAIGVVLAAALGGSGAALAGAILLLLGLVAVSVAASITRYHLAATQQVDVSSALAHSLGRRAAQPVPLRTVSAGELATSLASDTTRVGSYPNAVARLVGAVCALLVVAAYLLVMSVPLGLAVLIGVPVVMLGTAGIARPLEGRHREHRRLLGELGDLGADLALGLRILRGIGAETPFRDRYRATSARTAAAGVVVGRTQAVLDAARVLLPGLFLVLVVWWSARLAVDGRIGPGELVAFYAAAAFLVEPVHSVVGFVRARAAAAVAAQNLRRALVPAAGEQPTGPDLVVRGDLTERGTGLRAAAGELTAVLVEPGFDASGLAESLAGVPAAPRWRAELGDVPLGRHDRTRLRAGVVLQGASPTLFSGRLRSVLDPWGEADDAALHAAVRAAVCDELVQRLPEGLATVVGPAGREFSGGQRQRVALARSLLRDPAYLVLVEPTDALDSATEIRVAHRLRQARSGRTTVVFTRSPAWAELADRVVLLGERTIIGTHRRLLEGDERYRRLLEVERWDRDA